MKYKSSRKYRKIWLKGAKKKRHYKGHYVLGKNIYHGRKKVTNLRNR